jgi:tetratricopeptide (TPR) repeat protein
MWNWMKLLTLAAVSFGAFTVSTGCLRSPEAKKARYLETGKKQMEQKDYARALLQFKNAVQMDVKDAESWYQLGRAYLSVNDVKSAVASFRKAAELNPKHEGAQLSLANVLALAPSKEIVEDAQKRLEQIIQQNPNNIDALDTLALTEIRLGDPAKAEERLTSTLNRFPTHLNTAVGLARLKLAKNDLAGAEEVLKKVAAQSPKLPEPAIALGELYVLLKRNDDAEQQFRHAVELDPKSGPALFALAGLHARLGKSAEAEDEFRRLSAMPVKEYAPYYGIYLFQTGKRGLALQEFERLAKQDPSDRTARTRLVAAYLADNRTADAERVLSEALKKNPKDSDALLQRSSIWLRANKLTEAQTDLNTVLKFKTDSAEAHYLLSKVHQLRGSVENQKQELGEAMRVNPRFLAARLDLTSILIATGGAKSALQMLQEAPESVRRAPALQLQRCRALIAAGDLEEARKTLDGLGANATAPEAVYLRGIIKFQQKDYAGARDVAEEVLKQTPADLRSMNLLVRAYTALKVPAKGLQRIEELAAAQPKSPEVQYFLAQMRLANGRRAEARQALEAVKTLAPKYEAADISLAQLDEADGKLAEARGRLTELLKTSDNAAARLLLAEVENKLGNPGSAITEYRKLLDKSPNNIIVLNNLACLLVDAKQPDEALKFAQQAKEQAPDSPAVDDTLGWVYYQKGMYSAAVRHLERAVSGDGTAKRRYHLAMAYARLGDTEKGRKVLESALRMDKNLPEAQAAEQLLK